MFRYSRVLRGTVIFYGRDQVVLTVHLPEQRLQRLYWGRTWGSLRNAVKRPRPYEPLGSLAQRSQALPRLLEGMHAVSGVACCSD